MSGKDRDQEKMDKNNIKRRQKQYLGDKRKNEQSDEQHKSQIWFLVFFVWQIRIMSQIRFLVFLGFDVGPLGGKWVPADSKGVPGLIFARRHPTLR